jgi:drug/metabolite transporter (DMT)-like permease
MIAAIRSMPALYKGAALIVISEMALVLTGMVIRHLVSMGVSTEMLVLARNLLGLSLLLPWLMRSGFGVLRTQHIGLHFARASIGIFAMYCLFISWGYLPLAQAALIKQTAPFFIPLVALFWLKERITSMTIAAIGVGFVGVWLILDPSGEVPWIALLALFGAALGGTAKVVVRKMRATERSTLIVFYFAFFTTIISAVPAIMVWQTPDLLILAWMLLMAGLATVAQLLLSKGYGYAAAGQLGPFTYASVAFAALMGFIIWDESLSVQAVAGIVLVTLAGIIVMVGDRLLRKLMRRA